MEAKRQTLLAKLAPLFGSRTENLAVEALGHILAGSEPARRALVDLLRAGGADIRQVVQVRTQDAGEDGARPDLVGFDERGAERLLIEAKFWAGLTENQPVGYLERLSDTPEPTVLLFVAPADRIESLWAELRRLVETADLPFDSGSDGDAFRSAGVGTDRHLMLTGWGNLLDGMELRVGDEHEKMDIRQLRGLAAQQDDEAFLPLRAEEFGPEFPRRLHTLRGLVDDVTNRARTKEIVGTEGMRVTPQAYGYGRYVRMAGDTRWFGINAEWWARTGMTPLWLWVWQETDQRKLRSAPDAPALFGDGWIPIRLPLGKEKPAVIDAVVETLRDISERLA